jgi:hypothetical protein
VLLDFSVLTWRYSSVWLSVIGNQVTESKMTPDISHLNCTKREKQMIKELFDKHQDVFTKDDTDLGFSTTVQPTYLLI